MSKLQPNSPNNMSAEKKEWIREQVFRVVNATRSLQAAKKQRVTEYDERLRSLKTFAESLMMKHADSAQLEMFEPEAALTPDLEKLLASPLKGLD